MNDTLTYLKQFSFQKPAIGIILGSGLGSLTEKLDAPITIPYQDIPHFAQSHVQGHKGALVFGQWHGIPVVMMQGRYHYYEGFSMKEVVFPIKVMHALGIKSLVISNACGAINENYQPGDLVLIDDFINLAFNNPLIGPNDDNLGPRFVDMSAPYSQKLQQKFLESNQINLAKGVYGYFSGPYYETRAEIQAFKTLGCDLIGMSTVPETIYANYLGLAVLGISIVTNMATGIRKEKHSHQEVLEVANAAAKTLMIYLDTMMKHY